MAFYDEIHTSKKYRLGTRKRDVAGNEYVYLKGVASLADEDFVTYDTDDYTAVRAVADATGLVAVACAAVDAATSYGWFGIWGNFTGDTATVAANKALYLTSTAGRLDDADAAGDAVVGIKTTAADSSNSCNVSMNYPFVHDIAID